MDLSGIDINKLDLSDPEVIKALETLEYDQKYNEKLGWFYDNAYDWQRKAISLTSDHKVTGLICGNQMGKSETAMAIVAAHLTGVYPEWWEGKRWDHPVNVWVAGPDGRHNREVLQDRLFGTDNKRLNPKLGTGMIPRDAIVDKSIVSLRGNDIDSVKIKHISGGESELSFRAYTQGREAAQGKPVHCIVVDEQPNGEWWKEALTRTRATQGHAVLAFTPLKDAATSGNLLDNLMDLPGEEGGPEDQFGPKSRSDGKWAMVRASWYDAPHIFEADPDAIEEAKREYSFDYEARVFGIPIVGSGRIYPHRIEDIIYNPSNKNIQDKWDHLISVDFGWAENDPSAMLHIAWDKESDEMYVVEEFKGYTPTDKEFVKHANFIGANLPIAWPRDGNKAGDWKGGGTISDTLRSMGLKMLKHPFSNKPDNKPQCNALEPGFREVNNRFLSNRLFISADCQQLLQEIEKYGYGKDMNGQTTGKPAKYSDDHLCDALRYAVMTIRKGRGEPIVNKNRAWIDDIESYTIKVNKY